MTRSLKKNPFVANRLLRKIDNLNTKAELGERRELNPRVVDSQSTALIHLATSAPTPRTGLSLYLRSDPFPHMTAIKENLFPIL